MPKRKPMSHADKLRAVFASSYGVAYAEDDEAFEAWKADGFKPSLDYSKDELAIVEAAGYVRPAVIQNPDYRPGPCRPPLPEVAARSKLSVGAGRGKQPAAVHAGDEA